MAGRVIETPGVPPRPNFGKGGEGGPRIVATRELKIEIELDREIPPVIEEGNRDTTSALPSK